MEKSVTEKREDFIVELTKLITEFHEKNPELFIDNINIYSATNAYGDKILASVSVDIVVQPNGGGKQ